VTEVSSSVGHFGVPDQMRTGFSNVKSALTTSHPLEATEKTVSHLHSFNKKKVFFSAFGLM